MKNKNLCTVLTFVHRVLIFLRLASKLSAFNGNSTKYLVAKGFIASRHRKRRLVSDSFACEVARLLRDGGMWRLATDWDDYAWQMRDVIEACEFFENPHAGERPDPEDPQPQRGGFAPRFEGRVVTHFETRGIDAGRHAHDIVGIRRPRG